MNLYFYKPDALSLTIDAVAARDITEAFQSGRYVMECSEVKDNEGNVYLVTLVPKTRAVKQLRRSKP